MTYLVREGDVVRVRRPGHARVRSRGAVHRMEVVGEFSAPVEGAGAYFTWPKPVRCTGDHETMLTSRLVLDVDLQAMRGIVHGNQQVVPRVHEQVLCADQE